ncbi:MAG: hypothetical protein KIT73_06710 [Burkholderiales bacterium]|nr:hypothetical protein [Burkholderiales bacterium]
MSAFLAATRSDRIAQLVDAGTWRALANADQGAISGAARIDGCAVIVTATDGVIASGAIGTRDAEVLIEAAARARSVAQPFVLLLDSAGAKLTEGVAVLGAFRRLQAALLATAQQVPVAVVLGRHCFGGASLLAFAAHRRFYMRGGRLGLSGPRALQALGALLPDDEIAALYGAERRVRHDAESVLVSDDALAVRSALTAWLNHPVAPMTLEQRQRALLHRLRGHLGDPLSLPVTPVPPRLEARLDQLLPGGWSLMHAHGIVWGDGWVGGRSSLIAGCVNAESVNAMAAWRLAEVLLEYRHEKPDQGVTILLDSPGQSATLQDESLLLSAFVAQLSAALHALQAQGRSVELWLTGEAGGAIYVALAAAANVVTAWPGARLQTLPARAVSGVVGSAAPDAAADADWLAAGVIDRWSRQPLFVESVPP